MKTQTTTKDIGQNFNNPRYYFNERNTLLSVDLIEDHKIGKYTFKANTTLFFHRNGNVRNGVLIEGTTIQMTDGNLIKVSSEEYTYFNELGAPTRFKGIEDYYDKKTNLTYDTTKGVVLHPDGEIENGWAYSFKTEFISFDGGYLCFGKQGNLETIYPIPVYKNS